MLEVKDLHASVAGTKILKGLDLTIQPGEIHCIMGPNGSGKSTLSRVLAGHEDYEVNDGLVTYRGMSLLDMEAHERAREGYFLAFQYPVEIPGVSGMQFLRASVNAIRKHHGLEELDAMDLMGVFREKAKLVDLDLNSLKRSVNEGFSGGEKKRNEMFQMAVLEPRMCVLDEIDSGLDIDALKIVANTVNTMRSPERSTLIITHYQRLLEYIVPDYVHVMFDGRIVKSGGKELAHKLEAEGYGWIEQNEQMVV
ncbi:MAG: Fe-S cluster assembly ATPase SufC [Acidobacteriota bacterium]|nr:Fe-S cluster assembly ATPase SufC [Acidobacteriota bacterium]